MGCITVLNPYNPLSIFWPLDKWNNDFNTYQGWKIIIVLQSYITHGYVYIYLKIRNDNKWYGIVVFPSTMYLLRIIILRVYKFQQIASNQHCAVTLSSLPVLHSKCAHSPVTISGMIWTFMGWQKHSTPRVSYDTHWPPAHIPWLSHWQTALQGPSWLVTFCMFVGLRPALEGFVVTMHEGACETGSQIPTA